MFPPKTLTMKDGVCMYALKDGVCMYALKGDVCMYAFKDDVCMYIRMLLKFLFLNMT
jgi:hypothetical protein